MKMFAKLAKVAAVGSGRQGLGFGCMGMTAFYGDPMPDEKAVELLQTVYDAGCRHFDTAEVYRAENGLYNEEVLGKFFSKVPRDSFSVATKYLPQIHDNKTDYDTIKEALVASLKRLQVEYVDLYYCHRMTDLEGALEFAASAKRLQEEGLVREIGLSEIGPEWLRKVHETVVPIAAIQQEWSLLTRNLEEELVPMCKELDIAIVAYSPLARNLLATRVEETPQDWRSTNPRYFKENLEKNAKIVDTMDQLAEKYKCTKAQLALAWLYKKADSLGVSVIPIPGTTKVERAVSNIGSTRVEITDEGDVATLEALAEQVAGARGTESYISMGFENK